MSSTTTNNMSTPTPLNNNNEELGEAPNMAQSTPIAITNTLNASNPDTDAKWFKCKHLQLDLSSCYDEMLEYLRATGRFNEYSGLTPEGFSLESLDEYGERDGQFFTEYGLNPLIMETASRSVWNKPDKFTSHCFEDDEQWKEYYEEYVRIEKQANVLDVKLIFNNDVKLIFNNQEELYTYL